MYAMEVADYKKAQILVMVWVLSYVTVLGIGFLWGASL